MLKAIRRLARRIRMLYRLARNRCGFCGCSMTVRHEYFDCYHCLDARFCHKCNKTFAFASMYGASPDRAAQIVNQ